MDGPDFIRKRPEKLTGEVGLMAAVISQAVRDATGRRASVEDRADARRYLASRDYEAHIKALGLPGDAIPKPILEAIHERREDDTHA